MKTMNPRQTAKAIGIALLLAMLVTACGGDAAPETAAATTPENSATTTATAEPAPDASCPPRGAVLATRFSTVYKGCIGGVHTYYEKTECVKDSNSGLTWQGQTPAGSGNLRDNDRVFTNLDSVNGTQNYNSNAPIDATLDQIVAGTNSLGFQNSINATNLCGKSNWRLPTRDELFGILDASQVSPAINMTWFPNTASADYWTSTPFISSPAKPWLAHIITFDFAGNNTSTLSDYRIGGNASSGRIRVRLVHN